MGSVALVGEAGLETVLSRRVVRHAWPWNFQGFRAPPSDGTERDVTGNDIALGNWWETKSWVSVRKGLPESGRIGWER
jgi:hypothetical protein